MKIQRLDLIAFGPFSNVALDFEDTGVGLHLVYGPNEAGKSSCLRALHQWLYGIPIHCSDNFIHSNTNLRIGGVLEHSTGIRLEFVRRKGRDKTIRAGHDDQTVVDPAQIAQMLGNVDADIFSKRFGIDYPELVRGGAAIASGGGELGEVLFAAGEGLADVRGVHGAIDKEMKELFVAGPRSSKPRINSALKQLSDARARVKKSWLPSSKWVEHDRALRQLAKRLAELDGQLFHLRSRLSQLERVSQALPLLSRRKGLQTELMAVADSTELPDDFSTHREEAMTQLALAKKADRDAEAEIQRLNRLISEVDLPIKLWEQRATIARLHTDLGAVEKATTDRRRVASDIRTATERAERILRELGNEPDLKNVDKFRITPAQRVRIQELASEWKARCERQNAAEKIVQKLTRDKERIEREPIDCDAVRDASELARHIRLARKLGDIDHQLAAAESELLQLESQADVELSSLPLLRATINDLDSMVLPLAETVDRFESDFASTRLSIQKHEERLAEFVRQMQAVDQRLETIRLEQDVPAESDLLRLREQRDTGWRWVKRVWRDGLAMDDPELIEYVKQTTNSGDLADGFESSLAQSDAIADRLRREADRVSEKSRLTADRLHLDSQLAEERQRLSVVKQNLEQLIRDWRDQWASIGIDPLPPREMIAWLRRWSVLIASIKQIRQCRSRVSGLSEQIEQVSCQLVRELVQLGRARPDSGLPLFQLIELCEIAVEQISGAQRKSQDRQTRLEKVDRDLGEAELDLENAQAAVRIWGAEWAVAVTNLGLHANAAPAEANAILQSVEELLQSVKEINSLQQRVNGIDRDYQAFKESVSRLLIEIDIELKVPEEQAVAELFLKLEECTRAHANLDTWKLGLQNKLAERAKAQTDSKHWQEVVDSLCRQANCLSAEELIEAERRSNIRTGVRRQLFAINEQLVELAAGEDFDSFLSHVESHSVDRLAAEKQRDREVIGRLEVEKTEVAEAMGGHRNELSRMDGSPAAAEAQEEVEHLMASIRNDAEQYIRLRLASTILHRAIERFRESSQGPVLSRAGQIFSELTLGSFAGLRADYDDAGRGILVGVRPSSGLTVDVGGMSDGTCDQMYLSLRLALLEAHIADHEPLPLILDDILIKFDDPRSAATLRILAQLSTKTQIIFFTHHHRLVELAGQHLQPDQWKIHELNCRPATTALT